MARPKRPMENVLDSFYRSSPSNAIAFLDETYKTNSDSETGFYVISAVLIEKSKLPLIRQNLVNRVNQLTQDSEKPGYWHTTEHLRDEAGRQRVANLINLITQHPEDISVLIFHAENIPASEQEDARQAVLKRLLSTLTSTTANIPSTLSFVMERRSSRQDDEIDRTTHKNLKLTRQSRYLLASPSEEKLLFFPDIVCSAYRRAIAWGEYDLLGLMKNQMLRFKGTYTLNSFGGSSGLHYASYETSDYETEQVAYFAAKSSVTPTHVEGNSDTHNFQLPPPATTNWLSQNSPSAPTPQRGHQDSARKINKPNL